MNAVLSQYLLRLIYTYTLFHLKISNLRHILILEYHTGIFLHYENRGKKLLQYVFEGSENNKN